MPPVNHFTGFTPVNAVSLATGKNTKKVSDSSQDNVASTKAARFGEELLPLLRRKATPFSRKKLQAIATPRSPSAGDRLDWKKMRREGGGKAQRKT